MPRLAYRRAALLFVALAARPAAASDPMSTFCTPKQVDLLPDAETATRVVIHGTFFQLTSPTAFSYSTPKCGVMYFECPAGQEAMCRMQWKELRDWYKDPIHKDHCAGFGGRSVVATAAVRLEGGPLGTPDTWDLGMGIGVGQYVDAKCPMALALQCDAPASDAGALPHPGNTIDASASPPEEPSGAPDAGTATPPATVPPVTVPPTADASSGGDDAQPHLLSGNRSGCALAGGARSELTVAALGICAVALARRRRRA